MEMRITAKSMVAAVLLVAACSSSNRVTLLEPQIQLFQEPIAEFLLQYRGNRIAIPYTLAVKNPSGEPITLRRVELQNVGTGAYYLRRLPAFFQQVIRPDETRVVNFTMDAVAQGGRLGANEPVTVRGIAYFESSTGNFQKVFMQTFRPVRGSE